MINFSKIVLFLAVIAFVSLPVAEAKVVDFKNSSDSMMRKYQQAAIGNEPSPGYYTYWSVYVASGDGKPHWVEFSWKFDSGIVKEKVYIVPGYYKYISAPGYMKTWTNRVNITVTTLT